MDDRELRQIREIVAKEVADALREQLPKVTREMLTEREFKRGIDALEDRIVKRLA